MLDLFNIAQPQNCDIQIYQGFADAIPSTVSRNWQTWNKPRGVSHVYMLLIGGGGAGDGTTGGGSGAVTVWYGAAQHVPDSLAVYVRGTLAITGNTLVAYRSTSGTPVTLLTAQATTNPSNGSVTTANQFAASGFYQNVAGQNGNVGGINPSSTTFLSGGGDSGDISNYGLSNGTSTAAQGLFQLQPVIVGVGGGGSGRGGIGCGGGNNTGVPGGPGLVLIASW